MTLRTDRGCGTPPNPKSKEVHRRLLHIFSPSVHFDSGERFFPVDLPTTVANSSLWKLDLSTDPWGTNKLRESGKIQSANLQTATRHHYTTVAGTGSMLKKFADKAPVQLPVPLKKKVLQAYTDGTISAELTMYGMVCTAKDVAGAGVVRTARPVDEDVADAVNEGVLLNYWFYFPYRESPEFESEGDWSGISLLMKGEPKTLAQVNNGKELQRFLPVLTCYYRKTIEGAPPSPHFVAGTDGFRRWAQVTRGHEPSVGLDTHPRVYISRGRHNCRYRPGTINVPLSPLWSSGRFTPDGIEDGSYAPAPADTSVTGGGIRDIPWWIYPLFPPMMLLVLCATGCETPDFPDPIPPAGYQDGEDRADSGGYEAQPAGKGSSYPKTKSGKAISKKLAVRLRYVDLDDAGTSSRWGYPGAWGAATKIDAPYAWEKKGTHSWGTYQGARRPNLAAWFMWNLFLDDVFGCQGVPEPTKTP